VTWPTKIRKPRDVGRVPSPGDVRDVGRVPPPGVVRDVGFQSLEKPKRLRLDAFMAAEGPLAIIVLITLGKDNAARALAACEEALA